MKYEFTGETKTLEDDTVVRRIRALEDVGSIPKGTVGGWIEKETNLSQEGTCWVGDEAVVFENAKVLDNAQVSGEAYICGNATVCGGSIIKGKAVVYNKAMVSGGTVLDEARISNNSVICDEAFVGGRTIVVGDSMIGGNSFVIGHSTVSDARIFGSCSIDSATIKGANLDNGVCMLGGVIEQGIGEERISINCICSLSNDALILSNNDYLHVDVSECVDCIFFKTSSGVAVYCYWYSDNNVSEVYDSIEEWHDAFSVVYEDDDKKLYICENLKKLAENHFRS